MLRITIDEAEAVVLRLDGQLIGLLPREANKAAHQSGPPSLLGITTRYSSSEMEAQLGCDRSRSDVVCPAEG